jgi:hypothetical protein
LQGLTLQQLATCLAIEAFVFISKGYSEKVARLQGFSFFYLIKKERGIDATRADTAPCKKRKNIENLLATCHKMAQISDIKKQYRVARFLPTLQLLVFWPEIRVIKRVCNVLQKKFSLSVSLHRKDFSI